MACWAEGSGAWRGEEKDQGASIDYGCSASNEAGPKGGKGEG